MHPAHLVCHPVQIAGAVSIPLHPRPEAVCLLPRTVLDETARSLDSLAAVTICICILPSLWPSHMCQGQRGQQGSLPPSLCARDSGGGHPSLRELPCSTGRPEYSVRSPDTCAGVDNGDRDLGMAIREPSRLIAHEFSVRYHRLSLHFSQAEAGLGCGTLREGIWLGAPGERNLGNSS